MDNREFLQEITKRIDELAKETREHADKKAEETKSSTDARIREAVRELRVVVEDSQRPIRVIADGHMMLVQRVDRLQGELKSEMAVQADRQITVMRGLDEKLAMDLRAEIRNELAEVRRVGRIEAVVGELAARVERIEQKIV